MVRCGVVSHPRQWEWVVYAHLDHQFSGARVFVAVVLFLPPHDGEVWLRFRIYATDGLFASYVQSRWAESPEDFSQELMQEGIEWRFGNFLKDLPVEQFSFSGIRPMSLSA